VVTNILLTNEAAEAPAARVRPDQKVVLFDDWERAEDRLKGTTAALRQLVQIAEAKKAA